MGFWRRPLALIAVLVLAATGCAEESSGITRADADQPGIAPSNDGNGVTLGSPDAPVQLEAFIEPQCPHCAEFESTYGDNIAGYLADGRLAITYRPMTFLDNKKQSDTSARIGNALFLAVDVATSATAYQAFVQNLYRHQSPDGPTNNDIAAMARESGVPEWVATRMAAGDPAVDNNAMAAANTGRLKAENPANPVTPTVYDLRANSVVDIQDPDWLDDMFS
jgi:hypothetical protein